MRKLRILAIASTISIMSTMTSFANWEQQADGAWKYKDDISQQYVVSQWIESASEKGLWYYVGADGLMAVNTTTPDGYYVNEKGEWHESAGGSGGGATEQTGNKKGVGSGLLGSVGYTVPEREVYVP